MLLRVLWIYVQHIPRISLPEFTWRTRRERLWWADVRCSVPSTLPAESAREHVQFRIGEPVSNVNGHRLKIREETRAVYKCMHDLQQSKESLFKNRFWLCKAPGHKTMLGSDSWGSCCQTPLACDQRKCRCAAYHFAVSYQLYATSRFWSSRRHT